jgi:hypothetical protein
VGKTDLPTQSGPDVGAQPLACTPAPHQPTSLGLLEGDPFGSGIALLGDRIFVGVEDLAVPPDGQIVGVSLSTGASTTFRLGRNIAVFNTARPEALFYAQGEMEESSPQSWVCNYTHVARLDLQTEQVSLLDNPPDIVSPNIQSVVGNANGDIFWVVGEGWVAPEVLMGWDPSTATAKTLLRTDQIIGPQADTSTLYWRSLNQDNHVVFLSMPIAGGPVSVVVEWFGSVADAPSLLAVDEERIYYNIFSDVPSGIMAMPKAGGQGKTIIHNVQPTNYAIDDTHIYWVNNGAGDTIYRAPKDGGEVETFWAASTRWVMDLAVDACNVYWTVLNPAEIFARAK